MESFVTVLTVFVLAMFVGWMVITKVPPLLHTPLMSLTNAISAISVVGAILIAGGHYATSAKILGTIAVAAAMTNVVGGFLITERMLDTIPWTGGERVLDVGCGPGLSLIAAAKRLTTGRAVGIDKWAGIHGERHNSKDITMANARIEGVTDRIEVKDGDAAAMPFADSSFDVVVSSFVFHHLSRDVQSKALGEIARVTRPGGRILITDDRTDRLAAELRALGLEEVENRRVVFPIHLLSARKASILST